MEEYIVIASRLNKRRVVPSTLPEKEGIEGIVFKDHRFYASEADSSEIPNASLGKWYKDRDGYFYWGGGLEKYDPSKDYGHNKNVLPAGKASRIISDYGIDRIWNYTRGENVKIAVIDTGLNYSHSNIKEKRNITYLNIHTNSTDPADCFDTEGHGTRCAGIIAAHGPEIIGVAPDADLLVIKATVNGNLECRHLAVAIDEAVKRNADIISVSYALKEADPDLGLLTASVKNASDNNVLIVACTGNSGSAMILSNTYPACFPDVIAVGACDEERNFWKKTTMNTGIDILAPGCNIEVPGQNPQEIVLKNGTSYAAPYVAGFCALCLSAMKRKELPLIREALKQKSADKQKIGTQIREYYALNDPVLPEPGIISPFETFTHLIS
jgi:subtilisin family serine protease